MAKKDKSKEIKVAVCIPATDYIVVDFMHSLLAMQGFTNDWNKGQEKKGGNTLDVNVFIFRSSLLIGSRTELVRDALKWGADWILWLDSDMAFPPDTLLRLLDRKLPIVAANYVKRGLMSTPVTTDKDRRFMRTDPDSTGLEEADSTGFGVLLVTADVFRKLDFPWFDTVWLENNDLMGEDVFFFKKVKHFLNLSLMIDHDLSQVVRHIGTFEYHNRLAKATIEDMLAHGKEDVGNSNNS
jgi:hypothetical protein